MLVIIESPYAGDISKNKEYLQKCIRHCFALGAIPFASHQMYTDALNDNIKSERDNGISAGQNWMRVADEVWVFLDYGISEGMMQSMNYATQLRKPIRTHYILVPEEE